MRTPREYQTANGPRWRVRYRQGGTQTSETFRHKRDADTFAAVLDGGGAAAAHAWLLAREQRVTTPTFAEWFTDYVDQLTGVTVRTRDDYRAQHRRYLTSLDTLPLDQIGRGHVTAIVNRMEADGLAAKTIKNVFHMLSSCLGLAVEEGVILRNPCRRVRLPRRALGGVEARFLLPAEVTALHAALPEHYRPLVMFLIGTGARWSEATALQARHIDLEAGTVRIEQAWKRTPNGYEIGVPKTEKGRRTINAAVLALAAVKPLLRGPNDLVFTTPSGLPVRHNNFYNRVWKPACEAAGLDPRPRIHDCRHTHASWLISDGISLEAVQDQLGHESILTTRKVYGHLQPAIGAAVGKAASAALARALPDAMQISPGRSGRALVDAVSDPDESADAQEVASDVRDGGDG